MDIVFRDILMLVGWIVILAAGYFYFSRKIRQNDRHSDNDE